MSFPFRRPVPFALEHVIAVGLGETGWMRGKPRASSDSTGSRTCLPVLPAQLGIQGWHLRPTTSVALDRVHGNAVCTWGCGGCMERLAKLGKK